MVVPNRKLVNILFPSITSIASSSKVYNNMNMDVNVDTPRGRSINSSTNNFRELLVYSSLHSIFYIEGMETQSNNPSWADQVDEFDKS